MQNFFASELAANLGILVARLVLGGQLLIAGYQHLYQGIGAFAHDNKGNVPSWVGREAGHGYSSCLPFVELAAGAMLTLGVTPRVGAALGAVMWLVVWSAHGFRFAGSPLPAYVALSVVLLCLGGGRFTIDRMFPHKQRGEGPA